MTVSLNISCSATGPWTAAKDLYTIPQTTQYPDEFAYIATFHPELSSTGLVTSYNVDTLEGLSALERDDHQYQPHFIVIGG